MSDKIARNLRAQFHGHQRALGDRLKVFLNHSVQLDLDKLSNPPLQVVLIDDSDSSEKQVMVDALFICSGTELEKNQVRGPYKSTRFWENDTLLYADCGLPNDATILISGDGDGALQDIVRAFSGEPDPAQIWNKLEKILGPDYLRMFCSSLFNLEVASLRRLSWENNANTHEIQEQIFEQYKLAAGELLKYKQVEDFIHSLDRGVKITWLHRCSHFSISYPINRLLVQMLLQANLIKHFPNAELVAIESADAHDCNEVGTCFGAYHYADYVDRTCLDSTTGPEKRLPTQFNLIVMRHGPQKPDCPAPPQTSWQFLPFEPSAHLCASL